MHVAWESGGGRFVQFSILSYFLTNIKSCAIACSTQLVLPLSYKQFSMEKSGDTKTKMGFLLGLGTH